MVGRFKMGHAIMWTRNCPVKDIVVAMLYNLIGVKIGKSQTNLFNSKLLQSRLDIFFVLWTVQPFLWGPVWDVVNSIWLIRINYLLFLEDSCRCSLQHAAGHSVQAAEARYHTGPAMTSQCSGPRACRDCCHTRWCRSHTDALQTLKRGSRQCFSYVRLASPCWKN